MINAKTWNPAQINQAIRRLEGIIRSGSYNPAEINQLLNQLGEPGYINTWNPAELDQKLRTLLYDLLTWKTATGNPIQIRTNNGGLVQSCEVTFSPIQSGSGDPSPSNIRPISGRDSVVLGVSGYNLWDEEWESGSINASGQNVNAGTNRIRSKNYIPVLPQKTYYFYNPTYYSCFVYFYKKDYTFIEMSESSYANQTFTTPADCYYIRFRTNDNYGTTYNNNLSINYPATVTTYSKYTGNTTHTATFPDTIYGGSYDFVSGEGISNYGMVDLGDFEWTRNDTYGHFNATIPDMYVPESSSERNKGIICSQYKPATGTNANTMTNGEMLRANGKIYIMDTNYTTATDFKTAMSGVQLCYELATPTEITLTAEQIELLKGQNVLWTDGDNIEITYKKLLLPSDVESLSKIKKIEEKPKTKRSKKKKEE